jgi:hypothetical protein
MIPFPTGVRVWVAAGHTDMRRGMRGLALQVAGGAEARPAHRRFAHYQTVRRGGAAVEFFGAVLPSACDGVSLAGDGLFSPKRVSSGG